MEQAVRDLLDKSAIEDVLVRYCRTLDWLDAEGHADVYWPEAEIDYGFFKGSAAEFVPVVMKVERASRRRWHTINTIQVNLLGNGKADVECYSVAGAASEQNGEMRDRLFGGRYLDRFEKRGEEWRIAKRTYILDWKTEFAHELEGASEGAFPLNVFDIRTSGHPAYRKM